MAPPLSPLPRLDQLPLRKGDPPNSAWGLWGDGPDSALGALNHLTEERVSKAVREEVKTGERVGLKSVFSARYSRASDFADRRHDQPTAGPLRSAFARKGRF